jgi:hypothetical protein
MPNYYAMKVYREREGTYKCISKLRNTGKSVVNLHLGRLYHLRSFDKTDEVIGTPDSFSEGPDLFWHQRHLMEGPEMLNIRGSFRNVEQGRGF